MTVRQKRKEVQLEGRYPENFTCGKCKKVHPFDENDPYACTEEEENPPEE